MQIFGPDMAVPIGKGRFYKLFTGSSQPKRLLIEDITAPGFLSDVYVQGDFNSLAIYSPVLFRDPNFCWVPLGSAMNSYSAKREILKI